MALYNSSPSLTCYFTIQICKEDFIMKKYLFILLFTINALHAYVYDTVTGQCENYTLDAEMYLFDNNNNCILTYQLGDIYFDSRYNKTFQVTQPLQCTNNSNIWYGKPLLFDTANPLTCSTGTLNTTTCTCSTATTATQTPSATTVTVTTNNTLGMTDTDFNFLMGVSGTLFGAIFFFLYSYFLMGL